MKPLVPEDIHRPSRNRSGIYLERACVAAAKHATLPFSGTSVDDIIRTSWTEGADITGLILRGVSSPATSTNSTWAASLATSAVSDFVSSLGPISAGAKLLDAAVRVDLTGINSISFPSRSGAIDPAAVQWVVEGAPIPVGQFAVTSATLGPMRKLGILTALTRETAEHGSGETILTTLLRESAALALDTSLFSNVAASSSRPAGLLNGVSALPAAANGDDAAMSSDLTALANAISDESTGIAFVMHPGQAFAARLRRGTTFPADIPIWPTLGVAEGTVIALDPTALVSAFGAAPEITASAESLLHMESASPLQISSGTQGSGVLATPERSLFQTDCIGLRLILRAAWTWRAAGAISWIQNTTW